MLKIGEKIKELRKSQDVTRKVGYYLNISYRAYLSGKTVLHCLI